MELHTLKGKSRWGSKRNASVFFLPIAGRWETRKNSCTSAHLDDPTIIFSSLVGYGFYRGLPALIDPFNRRWSCIRKIRET
jgi:hypothetical protein